VGSTEKHFLVSESEKVWQSSKVWPRWAIVARFIVTIRANSMLLSGLPAGRERVACGNDDTCLPQLPGCRHLLSADWCAFHWCW